jgi:hypothetical protein
VRFWLVPPQEGVLGWAQADNKYVVSSKAIGGEIPGGVALISWYQMSAYVLSLYNKQGCNPILTRGIPKPTKNS